MDGIPGPGEGWDAKKMLDFYIYDYMKKKNMPQAAEIFARETNILDDLPPADEGFLTDWWSIFWDIYSAESPSSLVQVDSALQSIRQETPVVIHQPAPLGVDLSSTMMTGQQPAGQLLAANNYQLGDLPLSPPLFELNPQLQVHARQVQAQAQADRQARVQTISRAQTVARARTQQEELRAQLQEMAQLQEIASSNNISYKELLALRIGALTQPQVPPSGINHGVIDQPAPLGADVDSTMMRKQQPAVGNLLTANNNQLGDLGLSPAQVQAQAEANRKARLRAFARAHAPLRARARQAELRAQLQESAQSEEMTSSSKASSQELLVLRMGALSQQQVPPRGHTHGVSLGRSITPGATRNDGESPGANLQRSEAELLAEFQGMASLSNASSQLLQALRMASQTQQQVPPRGNDGASPGANQQRTEADEGKEMGSGSNR